MRSTNNVLCVLGAVQPRSSPASRPTASLVPQLLFSPKGKEVLGFRSPPGISVEQMASVEDVASFPISIQEDEREEKV